MSKYCANCGKEIREDAHTDEIVNQWHRSCIKRFFGTKTMPEIDISKDVLNNLANANTQNGYTVPGVQKKYHFIWKITTIHLDLLL